MNKKEYAAPCSEVFNIKMEGMIATSLPIGSTSGDEQLSNRNEWSSDNWSNDESEWEE